MSLADRLMVLGKKAHTALYRRFDARFLRTIKGHPVVLLTVPGRKTGVARTTPVVAFRDGASYVVAGSAGGSPAEPQWFRNLRAATTAQLEDGDRKLEVSVRVAEGEEYDRLWALVVGTAPYFEDYRTKSGRTIPVAVLTPIG